MQQTPVPTQQSAVPAQQHPAHVPVQIAMPSRSGTSVLQRVLPSKHQKAEKAFGGRNNQLFMAAHTQQQPAQNMFDLQQPLIV